MHEKDSQIQRLAADILRLRRTLCAVELKYGRIYIDRDPVTQRNRVLATNAPAPDPRTCDL
jgi:hypothetical protein